MTKKQVLEDIYPDELEFIFDRMRLKELKRYEDYYNEIIASFFVFGGGDAAKDYFEKIIARIKILSQDKKELSEPAGGIDQWYEQYTLLDQKEKLTEEEEKAKKKLKEMMNKHIDSEISKLKKAQGK